MISVMMPVRNNLKYLQDALSCVLNQSYQDFEFVIVDDCSTEPVWDFLNSIEDSRVKIMRNEEWMGIPFTLNKILDVIKGDYICRQDADDFSDSHRFELEVGVLKSGADFVTSRYNRIDCDGNVLPDDNWIATANKVDSKFVKANIKSVNTIVGGAPMWNRKVFEKIGYFDPLMRIASDYNYWMRVLKFFDLQIVEKRLYSHRVHGGSHRAKTNEYIRRRNGAIVDFGLLARQRALSYETIRKEDINV